MAKRFAFISMVLLIYSWVLGQSADTFTVPIWHPDARWRVEAVGGCRDRGFLQGPASEAGYNSLASPAADWGGGIGHGYVNADGGLTFFGWYDFQTRRLHAIAGNGNGYLDGSFETARFCISGYNFKPNCTSSLDGRYLYLTDLWGGKKMLRVLDFKEQQVKTIIPNISSGSNPGLTCGDNGKIYMLTAMSYLVGSVFKTVCELTILADSGTIENVVKLDTLEGKMGGIGRLLPIAYDDVNNRLYCGQAGAGCYVHYWDLADGTSHGVVPIGGTPLRGRNVPGPFEGTDFYAEGGFLTFGPDDPEKRFLYMGHIDTYGLHRLDLKNKIVAALTTETGKPSTFLFSDSVFTKTGVFASFRWVNNGHDFTSGGHSPVVNNLFKRTN